MEMAANDGFMPGKRLKLLKWIVAIVAAGVAAVWVGQHTLNNLHETVVRQLVSSSGAARFSDIRRYKTGAVCGMVNVAGNRQRFIVDTNNEAILEEGNANDMEEFSRSNDQLCHD